MSKVYTVSFYECEHTSDLEEGLATLGSRVSVIKTRPPTCDGPEVGWAVISTTLSVVEVNDILEAACGGVAAIGDEMDVMADEEEGDYERERDEEEEDEDG